MPKVARELSALAVSRLLDVGMHAVGGAAGLHLVVGASGSKSWIARIMIKGKRRDVGLGAYPEVGLADARDRTRDLRRQVAAGIDPVAQRRGEVEPSPAEVAAALTFDEAAEGFIKSHRNSWANVKHAQQWENTLATYASPVIGKLAVGEIRTAHVVEVLKPIWATKTETATRVRERIERVISAADAMAGRDRLNLAS